MSVAQISVRLECQDKDSRAVSTTQWGVLSWDGEQFVGVVTMRASRNAKVHHVCSYFDDGLPIGYIIPDLKPTNKVRFGDLIEITYTLNFERPIREATAPWVGGDGGDREKKEVG